MKKLSLVKFITNNPALVIKGCIIGWFVGPTIICLAPYIGVGLYITAKTARTTLSWYGWGVKQLKGKLW